MINEFLIQTFLQKCDHFYYVKLLEFFHLYSGRDITFLDSLFQKNKKKKDLFYLSSIYENFHSRDEKDKEDVYYSFKARHLYKHFPLIYKEKIKMQENKVRILDYGCGSCKMVKYFSELCNQKEYWGVDIEMWDGKHYEHSRSKNSKLHFKLIRENKKVPFEEEYFDIVIISMVMHHIKNLDFVLSEITRILKKGGILIIREHDAITIFDKLLIEIEHMVYMYHDFNIQYILQKNYFSNYFSMKEITNELSKRKFSLIHHVFDLKHNFIKIQRQYNAYFIKS